MGKWHSPFYPWNFFKVENESFRSVGRCPGRQMTKTRLFDVRWHPPFCPLNILGMQMAKLGSSGR